MRVTITDDHPLITEAIASMLRSAGHTVVSITTDGKALLEVLKTERIDVVTLDISLPTGNGIEIAREVRRVQPDAKIIFVTQQTGLVYIRTAFFAGANGFVSKHSSSKDLLAAMEAVAHNRSYVSPGLMDADRGRESSLDSVRRKGQGLSQRQREVLELVAGGKTAKEMAAALNVSVKTIEFHKQALFQALDLHTTAELTRYAVAKGLITL